MSAIAYLALGALVAMLLAVLQRKDTADASATFGSITNAHRYTLQQDAAGYDCFISKRAASTWEVRCYRRKDGAA